MWQQPGSYRGHKWSSVHARNSNEHSSWSNNQHDQSRPNPGHNQWLHCQQWPGHHAGMSALSNISKSSMGKVSTNDKPKAGATIWFSLLLFQIFKAHEVAVSQTLSTQVWGIHESKVTAQICWWGEMTVLWVGLKLTLSSWLGTLLISTSSNNQGQVYKSSEATPP